MFRLGWRVILSTNKKYFSGKKMGVIMFLLKLGVPPKHQMFLPKNNHFSRKSAKLSCF